MAHKIGYSLIKIADGTEVAWRVSLPWRVDYAGGTMTLDKVGLEGPTGDAPTHRLVERWQSNDVPVGDWHFVDYGPPSFDGTRINVVGNYTAWSQEEIDARARRNSLEVDLDVIDMVNRIRTATAAQLDTYIDTNVTDLASAKIALKRIVKLIAHLLGGGGPGQ